MSMEEGREVFGLKRVSFFRNSYAQKSFADLRCGRTMEHDWISGWKPYFTNLGGEPKTEDVKLS